jgi:acetyltransferase-like isoleucine patch superfamily enzyme
MKAAREVGVRRLSKFFFASLFLGAFNLLVFPPLRRLALQMVGATIGADSVIHAVRFFNAYRAGFKALRLGKSCFLGDECLIDLADAVILADHVTLAERVMILTHTNVGYADHPLQPYFPPFTAPVRLERGAFIGANSTILPGVSIGEGAFIAAGSVVTETVPAWTLVGGVPARTIRNVR